MKILSVPLDKAIQILKNNPKQSTCRFLIWNPAANIPSIVHRRKRIAKEELQRLKRKNPDSLFLLLQIKEIV
jgi:hypothetical protein